MSWGFTYQGVHCEKYGLIYNPAIGDLLPFMPSFKPITATVTGRDGAYWYGNTVSERKFTLPCYFENVPEFTFGNIYQWLKRDTEGELIFDERPWVSYKVRPTAAMKGNVYVHTDVPKGTLLYSGTMSLEFTAYQPFGYMTMTEMANDVLGTFRLAVSRLADGTERVNDGSGVIPADKMPVLTPTLNQNLLVYNPGTEVTPAIIRIAGTLPTDGTLKIHNYTTGDVCGITGLPANDTLVIDGETGRVYRTSDNDLSYSYHNDGYISLAPCIPFDRDIEISYSNGMNLITSINGEFRSIHNRHYVNLAGKWYKILHVQDNRAATIDRNCEDSGLEKADIVVMNELYIEGSGTLTKFQCSYSPRIR